MKDSFFKKRFIDSKSPVPWFITKYANLAVCYCDSFFLPFRKFNMSCCLCMQPNCLKKITLDAMHCLEMTRYWVIILLFEWFCTKYLKIKQLFLLSYNLILSGLMMSKVQDLSRMFRLFSKIPRGLDPVSSIFKQVSSFQLRLHPFLFKLKGLLCVFLSLLLRFSLLFSNAACYCWRNGLGQTGGRCSKQQEGLCFDFFPPLFILFYSTFPRGSFSTYISLNKYYLVIPPLGSWYSYFFLRRYLLL